MSMLDMGLTLGAAINATRAWSFNDGKIRLEVGGASWYAQCPKKLQTADNYNLVCRVKLPVSVMEALS